MARTKVTPEPSHENTMLYMMRKSGALKRFDVDREAMRIARRRARLAEYKRKVT